MKLQIQQCTHERICCLVTEIRSCCYSQSILGCSQSAERVKNSSVTVWKRTSNLSSLPSCCDEMMKSEQEVLAWILQPFSSWFLWFLPTQTQLPPGLAAAQPGDWLLPLFSSPAALPHPAPPGHHPGQPAQLQRWVRVRVSLNITAHTQTSQRWATITLANTWMSAGCCHVPQRTDIYSPVCVLRAVFCVSGQLGAISDSGWSPEHSLACRDWGHRGKLTRTKPVTVFTQSQTGFLLVCGYVFQGGQAPREVPVKLPGGVFLPLQVHTFDVRTIHHNFAANTHTHTPKDSVSLIVSSLSSRW